MKIAAQAVPAQYKKQSVSVFAGALGEKLAYLPGAGKGFAFGLALNRHFRSPLTASLELRTNSASGVYANERSYLFGPRVEYRFGRLHPYGGFEVGVGNIHFNPAADSISLGDRSTVYAFGGGFDLDLFRHLAARADFQSQHWDLEPVHHDVFRPALLTVGVSYTIPFRPFHKQGDPYYK